MTNDIKKNDPITANTKIGIGTGHVHTVVGTNRFFVQIHVGRRLVNQYVDSADENKTWVRGHDTEALAACLASTAVTAPTEPPK